MATVIQVDGFLAYTIGIIVFFVGMKLNERVSILREYSIPEPVSGGILASVAALGLFLATGFELEYDLETRDRLLVYFFTTIGLNARFSDLIKGGRPLVILLVLTLGYIIIQDVVGVLAAKATGQPDALGVITGSVSLIGGHGTAIAWANDLANQYGIESALEVGIAAATLGLVMASLLGGPIAKYLLSRYNLSGSEDEQMLVGVEHEAEKQTSMTHVNFMGVLLTIHVAIIGGWLMNYGLAEFVGLKLPLFVTCLLTAIIMSNSIPLTFPKVPWPARTKALAIVSDFSLGLFIAMSLMGMQLWSIADLAGPLLVILMAQAIAAVLFILFVLFPMMGRNYMAAVLSAGFAGFSLGATPTAIANMTAVTKTYGPSPTAFIILPLVGAFFVDVTNAFVIDFFLKVFG